MSVAGPPQGRSIEEPKVYLFEQAPPGERVAGERAEGPNENRAILHTTEQRGDTAQQIKEAVDVDEGVLP
jgi:hypothetical protein